MLIPLIPKEWFLFILLFNYIVGLLRFASVLTR